MNEQPVLDLVKVLSHADRLRIVGALTLKRASAQEIAKELGLTFRAAINHLNLLEHAGLVRARDGLFQLETDGLERLARRQFEGRLPAHLPGPRAKRDFRRVLSAHLNPDGSIRQIPGRGAKLHALLDYLINAFEPGKVYSEKEVNTILACFNEDISGLRRDLVDAGLLERQRDGTRYWRPK